MTEFNDLNDRQSLTVVVPGAQLKYTHFTVPDDGQILIEFNDTAVLATGVIIAVSIPILVDELSVYGCGKGDHIIGSCTLLSCGNGRGSSLFLKLTLM